MIADSFQYVADILHLLSYVVLIKQIIYNKSVHGSQPLNREISYRTQEMFFLVYIFRYGDIIWNRHSIYLTTMKILYIGLTITIIYLVRFKKPYCLVVANHPGLRPACGQLQPLPLDLPIGFPLDGLCAHLLRTPPFLRVLLELQHLARGCRAHPANQGHHEQKRSVFWS